MTVALRLALAAALLCTACASPALPPGDAHDHAHDDVQSDVHDDVHYDDLGTGSRAFVLVPGWCSDGRVWQRQREAFAALARTLVVDLPGHGASGPSTTGYSMDAMADALVGVLDDAGVTQAVFVAHSNGTPVVRQLWRRHPERVLGLVAVDGSFVAMGPGEPAAIAAVVRGYAGDKGQQLTRGMFQAMLHPDLPRELRASLLDMTGEVLEEARLGTLAAALDPAIWTDDPVEAPVLAIMAASPFWTSGYWSEVEPLLPDLTRHELPDVSHFLMLDDAERFNRLVLTWVAERQLLP